MDMGCFVVGGFFIVKDGSILKGEMGCQRLRLCWVLGTR
jgi:hypothetical protein